jgi:NADH-quinone oxidoreductase subunit M
MLWMFQRVFYGKVTNEHNAHLPDLRPREWAAAAPLCALAIVMGVFPMLFLEPMEPAVRKVVERMQSAQPLRVERSFGPFDSFGRFGTFEPPERSERSERSER